MYKLFFVHHHNLKTAHWIPTYEFKYLDIFGSGFGFIPALAFDEIKDETGT